MGNPVPGYWREFITCSDGSEVMGTGSTQQEAESKAEKARQTREGFLSTDPRERLRSIVGSGTRLTKEGDDAIKAIAEILLSEKL